MNHYVIIDGVLQRSSPETSKWAKRAAETVPGSAPDVHETVQESPLARERTYWEIIESLDETE